MFNAPSLRNSYNVHRYTTRGHTSLHSLEKSNGARERVSIGKAPNGCSASWNHSCESASVRWVCNDAQGCVSRGTTTQRIGGKDSYMNVVDCEGFNLLLWRKMYKTFIPDDPIQREKRGKDRCALSSWPSRETFGKIPICCSTSIKKPLYIMLSI